MSRIPVVHAPVGVSAGAASLSPLHFSSCYLLSLFWYISPISCRCRSGTLIRLTLSFARFISASSRIQLSCNFHRSVCPYHRLTPLSCTHSPFLARSPVCPPSAPRASHIYLWYCLSWLPLVSAFVRLPCLSVGTLFRILSMQSRVASSPSFPPRLALVQNTCHSIHDNSLVLLYPVPLHMRPGLELAPEYKDVCCAVST